MTSSINTRTGLKEGHHDFYDVPQVWQKGINTIRVDGQVRAVHTVPLRNGLTLDFFVQSSRAEELFVALHGANRREKNIYPRFERVASLRKTAPALVAFADPSIRLDDKREMLLSWYLGGPDWDPLHDMMKVIHKVMGKCGAKRVIFVGGSGGGFAALRASAMFPGSMAFVQAPQTILERYIPHVVERYFETAWPGWDMKKLLQGFPDRFDMVRHYQQKLPDNYVYYMVSESDPSHVTDHYEPFKGIYGVSEDSGFDRSGRKRFVKYKGSVPGHGTVTDAEFDHHLKEALQMFRS
ncbi:hypothetical protein ACFFON_02750 [Arthrobacter citreus]|uniref:hypothetical protein n=1 Tax=Arthrobacter TaxID=1663 RepID=UPI0012659B5B|nr:hypothetical protein [Arthrobacter gandavensis]